MQVRRNILLFKLGCFFSYLWPLSVLAMVYFEEITGSYASALGIFSLASITQALADIPTGIFSDQIGRRRALIISSVCFLISFVLFALAGNVHSMTMLIVGGLMMGLAEAFASGSKDALIYETMTSLRKEHKYDIVYAASHVFSQLGVVAGSLLAILTTYFYSLNTLAWVSVLGAIGNVVVTALFVDPGLKASGSQPSIKHFYQTLKTCKKDSILRSLILLQMANKGLGRVSYRLEGVYFNTLIPTFLVNVNTIIRTLIGAVSFMLAPLLRHIGFFKIIITSLSCNVIIRLAGVVINNAWSPFIISCQNLLYGPEVTAESTLLQKQINPGQRATIGSIASLFICLFTAIAYYLTGLLADFSSVYFAMIVLILSKAGVSWWYYQLSKNKSGQNPLV